MWLSLANVNKYSGYGLLWTSQRLVRLSWKNNFPARQGSTPKNPIRRSSSQQSEEIADQSVSSAYDNSLSLISTVEDVERFKQTKKINTTKFRQHVNPLSRKFQTPCDLPASWPQKAYWDCQKQLYLDIGCGKGGFLLQLAQASIDGSTHLNNLNYLGLEIRPSVVEFAATRVPQRKLQGLVSFVGCNVNVDLERLLSLYQTENGSAQFLHTVSIQFPDPHFKERHKKRKVVNQELICTLAKYMSPKSMVFLQSDIQDVLDDMRGSFREDKGTTYFEDEIENFEEYLNTNPIGIPTEREVSVLEKDFPVYRTVFRRNDTPFS